MSQATARNITNQQTTDSSFNISEYSDRLKSQTNLTLPLDQELEILQQLSEFAMGRFLLKNKGFDGYWTSYMVVNGRKKNDLHPFESWLLTESPSVLATQERFKIFTQQIQKYVKSNTKIASVPCRLMDDVFAVDYSKTSNVELTGIDSDQTSLDLAKQNADQQGIKNVSFVQQDISEVSSESTYDIAVSNGLNMYEPNDQKVTDLYKQFAKILKKDGILITSFLTPPPSVSSDSPWTNYNEQDALKQKALFTDIIQAKWQSYRTEETTRKQFAQAGFSVVDVIYDSRSMFPTIIGKKI